MYQSVSVKKGVASVSVSLDERGVASVSVCSRKRGVAYVSVCLGKRGVALVKEMYLHVAVPVMANGVGGVASIHVCCSVTSGPVR